MAETPGLLSCNPDEAAMPLRVVDEIFGYRVPDLINLQIRIDPEHRDTFAFPTPGQRATGLINQVDFQQIADAHRTHDKQEYAALKKNQSNSDNSRQDDNTEK